MLYNNLKIYSFEKWTTVEAQSLDECFREQVNYYTRWLSVSSADASFLSITAKCDIPYKEFLSIYYLKKFTPWNSTYLGHSPMVYGVKILTRTIDGSVVVVRI